MHPSALYECNKFFLKYCKGKIPSGIVVDFGSFDVNGTLKPVFDNNDFKYIGIDMAEGPNVDIVCTNDNVPLENESVDVIVSSSNFEHDKFFWMTFLEMCRLIKPGGYIYINAPSSGPYHGFPGDCWRFYSDCWLALSEWAEKNNYNIELLESHINNSPTWKDNVGIFRKTIS